MLPSNHYHFLLLLLLSLVALSNQVDVVIGETHPWLYPEVGGVISCLDLPPGECCLVPSRPPWIFWPHEHVNFTNLLVGDIAAIWKASRAFNDANGASWVRRGCSGAVMASRPGPGDWNWRASHIALRLNRGPTVGASYIRVPQAVPVDPRYGLWMSMQGIYGLVSASSKWFASYEAEVLSGGGSVPSTKRGIRSSEKGVVYAGSPRRARYPDRIRINGTSYTTLSVKNALYSDEAGTAHNLTDWFQ